MNLHKMIEICLKDDNMHIFVMINALICINNYVITCMNIMLSRVKLEKIKKSFLSLLSPLSSILSLLSSLLSLSKMARSGQSEGTWQLREQREKKRFLPHMRACTHVKRVRERAGEPKRATKLSFVA